MASTNREIERLDILAVDLIGPFQVDSVDGGKYVMTMRDVATGYCFVCILTHKWEATGHMISITDKIETFTAKKVKTLRRNNGGEFVNNELTAKLDSKGILAEQALPYHHYQNGVIERFNRAAAAMARTILLDSTLPQSFWSYAFIWATHTLNRIPNKASGHVVAYLGTSKGWRLWIPDENRFIKSAMVRFPEELKHVPTLPTPVKVKQPEPTITDITPPDNPLQHKPAMNNLPAAVTLPVRPAAPTNKMSLSHVMNLMRLVSFEHEIEFHDQEQIIDTILELCQFYAILVPSTFKQAMRSAEKEDWLKAIAVELNNLEEMRVWATSLRQERIE
ncbi:hypothetical protein PCASD_05478 [Puccinia coronata f. sp. avenae]|uniref:Integrase catalytic domain-containing protein n=1 Tax=Puccinia coronata f. sp. avenae TaxID=200324 RepID=A0A2N5V8R5_9BASI|nr:hypothetical protein PCASD_05478 [Puccinia coronata f. sp. avenae]